MGEGDLTVQVIKYTLAVYGTSWETLVPLPLNPQHTGLLCLWLGPTKVYIPRASFSTHYN